MDSLLSVQEIGLATQQIIASILYKPDRNEVEALSSSPQSLYAQQLPVSPLLVYPAWWGIYGQMTSEKGRESGCIELKLKT